MPNNLAQWVDSVLKLANRPKLTEKNMYDPKNGCKMDVGFDLPELPTPCYFHKRKIIGFHGKLQSGKDTSAKFLIDGFGFKKLAFADALRKSLWKLNPIVATGLDLSEIRVKDIIPHLEDASKWEYAKSNFPEVRRLLQFLGTESGREIHGQDCWTNIIKRQIEENPTQDFVLTDVRFPNELQLIHDLGGTVIRVVRDNNTATQSSHISEQVLEGCDFTIQNDGTLEELRGKILGIIYPTSYQTSTV